MVFCSLPVHASLCNDILLQISKDFGEQAFSDNPVAAMLVDEPTVTIVNDLPGPHGGVVHRVQKIGPSWGSSFTTTGYDFQGDPRWFVETIGAEAAKFFGFEMISDHEMWVPNEHEFSAAIIQVNKVLDSEGVEPIHVRFYSTENSKNTSLTRYRRRFREDFALPIAPEGGHKIHDMSFHTGAIFLPLYLLQYAQQHIQYQEEFFEHLKLKYAKRSVHFQKALEYYIRAIKLYNVETIDTGTATVTSGILQYLYRASNNAQEKPSSTFFHGSIVAMHGSVHHLESPLGNTFIPVQRALAAPRFAGITVKDLDLFSRVYSQAEFIGDLKDFSDTYAKSSPHFDPRRAPQLGPDKIEKICSDINRRRLLIRRVVLGLTQR